MSLCAFIMGGVTMVAGIKLFQYAAVLAQLSPGVVSDTTYYPWFLIGGIFLVLYAGSIITSGIMQLEKKSKRRP